VALGPRSRHRLGPRAQRAWPAFTAWRSAVHAGAVTAPRRALWRGRRRCHSGGGGANGGGRAPTAVRLPAGHGRGENSSPELLVDGEGKKTGSAAAFFRRGGAMVVSDGPVTGRREGEVSSMLHRRKTARRGSAPLTGGVLATAEAAEQRRSGCSDSDGWLRTRRRRGQDADARSR
jgi:hypothetical protein